MSSYSEADSTDKWLNMWATREFGLAVANDTASIIATYGKLIIRRKYEMLSIAPFALSVDNYDEAENILQEWTSLVNFTQSVYDKLDTATQVPFFEMVLHPVLAGKTVQEVYIKAAINANYAKQQRTSANTLATAVRSAYAAD